MNNQSVLAFLAGAICCVATAANAGPFMSIDPRTLGMGGAGVAAGTGGNAALYNPALLAAARDDEDFSLELPMIVAGFADPEQLRAAMVDFDENRYVARFSFDLAAFNTEMVNQQSQVPPFNDLAELERLRDNVVASGRALLDAFRNISEKEVTAGGNVSSVLSVPSKSLGVSLFVNGWVTGAGQGVMTQADVDASNTVLDQAEQIDFTDQTNFANTALQGGTALLLTDPSETFTSFAQGRLGVFAEFGLAAARELPYYGGVSVGVTPKLVQVRTYGFKYVARELRSGETSFSLKEGERIYNTFNFDLGGAKDLGNGWKVGASVRNVIPRRFETADGGDIEQHPMLTAGVARSHTWYTLAADLDLTENQSVDFEGKSRYLSLGAELDAWRWAQLRLGLRKNLNGGLAMAALGVGLSPFGLHVDLAMAANQDMFMVGAQTGFRF